MTITNPGQLSHGMPAGSPLSEQARGIKDLQRQIDELKAAAAQQILVQTVSYNSFTLTFTGSSSYFGPPPIAVPPGCTRLTWSLTGSVYANTLATLNLTGELDIGPNPLGISWQSDSGYAYGASGGSAIAISANFSNAGTQGALTPGSLIQILISGSVLAGSMVAATGSVTINGVLNWTRA